MEMLKEKIAANGRQTLRVSLPEGSHVSSTRKEMASEVSESTTNDKGKKKVA